jgi:hypothetical protein
VPFRLGWLAPATTALLLACVLLNQHSGNALEGPVVAGPLVAAAISNQQAASWLPGSFARAQNSPPVRSFEWTNDRASVSSISSLSGARGTN